MVNQDLANSLTFNQYSNFNLFIDPIDFIYKINEIDV